MLEYLPLFILVFLCLEAFWLWTVIECLTSGYRDSTDKVCWTLVLLFLNFVGAILWAILAHEDLVKPTVKPTRGPRTW